MASYDPYNQGLRSGPGTENVNISFDSLRPVIAGLIAMVLLQQYFGSALQRTLYKCLAIVAYSLSSVIPLPLLNLLLKTTSKILTLLPVYKISLSPRLTEVLPSFFKTMSQDCPAGLGNFDNSCYQNSILQGLSSLPSLRDFLSDMSQEFTELGHNSINSTLIELLTNLNSPSENGQTLWTPPELKTMDSVNPQDAHEYFGSMMEYTEKELSKCIQQRFRSGGWVELHEKLLKENPSLSTFDATTVQNLRRFQNPLNGLFADRTMCLQCGYSEGLRLVDFNCLLTQFPKGYPGYKFSLEDLFREYMKLETVGPTRCAKCTLLQTRARYEQMLASSQAKEAPTDTDKAYEQTVQTRLDAVIDLLTTEDFGDDDQHLVKKFALPKKKWVETMKSKQSVIARAPRAFAININRSELDEATFELRKNLSPVRFPADLDLSPWVLGDLDESFTPNSIIKTPASMTDPAQSMLPNEEDICPELSSQLQYELRAVVRHQGYGHNNGHYICLKKHDLCSQADSHEEKVPSSEQWWSLSDEDVRATNEDKVLGAQGVFMLFYERKAPGAVYKRPATPRESTPEVQAPVIAKTEQEFPTLGPVAVEAPPKKKVRVRSKDRNKLQRSVPPEQSLPTPVTTSADTTPSSSTETEEPLAQPPTSEDGTDTTSNTDSQQINNLSESGPVPTPTDTTDTTNTSTKTQQPVPMRAGAGKRKKGRKSLKMVDAL